MILDVHLTSYVFMLYLCYNVFDVASYVTCEGMQLCRDPFRPNHPTNCKASEKIWYDMCYYHFGFGMLWL